MEQDLISFIYIVLISICCGFIIGFEREIHNKPAGLKTITLVVLGSSIFTFVSISGFSNTDDARVAAQIVSGVGFLGAGVILRSELKVMGLTTAATLWIAAAIGMLIGTGLVFHAIISSVISFILINALRILENQLSGKYMRFNVTLFLKNEEEFNFVNELLKNLQVNIEKTEVSRTEDSIVFKVRFRSDLSVFFYNFIKELEKRNIKYSL